MNNCKHHNFYVNVAVKRMMEDDQSTAEDYPIGFVADITIKYTDCNIPFHFIHRSRRVKLKKSRHELITRRSEAKYYNRKRNNNEKNNRINQMVFRHRLGIGRFLLGR